MIAIVDYGVGNLFSLKSSLAAVGASCIVTGDAAEIQKAEKIILPGVGAFGDAIQKLRDTGLDRVIIDEAANGKPIMGICLGMQLLFSEGHEYGIHKGLGLIPGKVVPIDNVIPENLKVPHIGWNALTIKDHPLFSKLKNGDFVYFVHSYYADTEEEYVIATAEYGVPLTAAAAYKNVCGCQFHPEKSGNVGLSILRAFCEEA